MSLEKLTGTRTLGGHFRWETTHEEKDWKIQHHKTTKAGLKPYRLLDPHNHLMAAADTEEEIKEYLNQLMVH
ncbi:hypothetical protein [uncultured Ilyobacter sp.]|uniref:hypothetical protein n=1 Tax=uncultured Ilyobacter sp. TaxID=544433 RepID=UPI0029F4D19C|nr:hypothetical protein [uncultured Ilyobacter sp.]